MDIDYEKLELLEATKQLEYVENRDFLNERLQKLKDAQE